MPGPMDGALVPEAARMQVDIPTPAPVDAIEVNIQGIKTSDGTPLVRVGIASPMFGLVYFHLPADQAEGFCGAIIQAARTVRSGIIVPQGPQAVAPMNGSKQT